MGELQKYDPTRPCPACGEQGSSIFYHGGAFICDREIFEASDERDHLHHRCTSCKAEWLDNVVRYGQEARHEKV